MSVDGNSVCPGCAALRRFSPIAPRRAGGDGYLHGPRSEGRHVTYMGKPYYPEWLDNLADDVTLEAAAMDGTAVGADDVRSILVAARELYEHQVFNYAGPCGESGFLE